jgi:3-deoxy-7-phosphoheptulonate synthase
MFGNGEFSKRRLWGPYPKYPLIETYEPRDNRFIVIAGPCSVESKEQIHDIAHIVKVGGATHLRGGVFRAGTYPGKNFGLVDRELIEEYAIAARDNGLKNIIEVLSYDPDDFAVINPLADCFQVGARSMQNYQLLRFLGREAGVRQIFLKRHPGSTMDEWLGAAEHILEGARGSSSFPQIVLIERGSVGHMNHVRWDLSISIIPAVHELNPKLQVIVDGSHGTGRRDLVEPMTLAGVAAGANGVLVEVHPKPDLSLSDADQAITPTAFFTLMKRMKLISEGVKNVY